MYDYTGNNWSHRRTTKCLNKRFEAITGKRSIGLLGKNITHNRESLKLEG